jgi:RNA polymerase sigma-70 factor (ECF subfamily)
VTYTDFPVSDTALSREGNISLVAAIAERSQHQEVLYAKFRRPLMQVFYQSRINPDDAQDLLQRTFLQAIKKIRAEGLDDPSNLGGYLHRTATNLAAAYWRGELARRYDRDGDLITSIRDEARSPEEHIDDSIQARTVRELMENLSRRDREVLERTYLHEEARPAICESMNMTSRQFNQVLWRARERFREILRGHGVSNEFASQPGTADGY